MIHANELQNGPSQSQFSMTLAETARMPLEPGIAIAEQAGAGRAGELTLTGSQLLAALLSVLSTMGLVFWAVIKLWIFEP